MSTLVNIQKFLSEIFISFYYVTLHSFSDDARAWKTHSGGAKLYTEGLLTRD
jgi:hypothetical protein